MLVDLLIHNCYLVIFTGKRTTGQFFIDKYVSLTAINMYLLVMKVLYNGRRPFYSTNISPQHLKSVVIDKNPNRLLHGALQISMKTRSSGNVEILELLNFGGTVCLGYQLLFFRFVKQIQHYA